MKLLIKQRVFAWGDTYSIQFSNPKDELMGMMLVVAIDAANCTDKD